MDRRIISLERKTALVLAGCRTSRRRTNPALEQAQPYLHLSLQVVRGDGVSGLGAVGNHV